MGRTARGCAAGLAGVAVCVALLVPFRESINSTPVALALLLIALLTAAWFGSLPAVVTSVAAVLCFNYFFLPPYGTFTISDPQNWVALGAFLVASLIAGSLSARVIRRAEEAERKQKEIQDLYVQLKNMYEKAGEAEIMKQSEQMKSALLDAVTHDLRTPLTSMKAAVTALLSGGPGASLAMDEEGSREMLEVIDAEIDRLNHHLEGLIEIAKIEAGAMHPRRSWGNMEEIVSISASRASGLLSQHRLKLDIEQNLPPIRMDEKSIAEVLYLLLENAAKYGPAGSVITVGVRSIPEGGLRVSVQDQGPGIPVEFREKVFDKFFRSSAEPGLKARPAGLGMGLAIARSLVEAHGGRIGIEDTETGKGTRVAFTLPRSAS